VGAPPQHPGLASALSTTIDKPHVLILTDHPGEDREWRVVHPPTCPWDAHQNFGPDGAQFWDQQPTGGHSFHRVCLTQYDLDNNGIDALDCYHLLTDEQKALDWVKRGPDWQHIPAGRYVIQCWSSWSGSWYDDADGGMDLIEPSS
jgi:hypothetical protein